MKNLFRYLSAPLLLISACQSPQAFTLPPQITTDIITEIEVAPKINPLDRWFVPTTENHDPYPSVGSLHREDGSLIGSSILIEPNVALTAAHCLDSGDVFFFVIGEEDIMVKETILHPDYSNTLGRIVNDIGLIFLECDSRYQPAKMGCVEWMERYDPITTVGYSFEYKKYSKKGVFRYFGTIVEEPNNMKFIPRPVSVWFGDSGGGVFAKFGKKEYLVGVISTFTVLRNYKNQENITECSAVIVAKHLAWIELEILNEEMEQIEEIVEDGR